MSKKFVAAAVAGALTVPAAAQAQQQRFQPPSVELFATVTGKWVLVPERCPDIVEDYRDAQRDRGRRDRREDRRDQRIADCPPEAYDFVVEAGQGPRHPVRVGDGRIPRRYRGKLLYENGDTIGRDGRPVDVEDGRYGQPLPFPWPTAKPPTYQAPTYQQPTIQQPTYQQPTYEQPTYQQPTYRQTPQPAPAPQPNYEIRDGVIYWLD